MSLLSQKPGCALGDPPVQGPQVGSGDHSSIQGPVKTQAPAWSRPPSFLIWTPTQARFPSPHVLPHQAPGSGHSGPCRPQALCLCPSLPLFPLQGSLALSFRKPWRHSSLLDTFLVPKYGLGASAVGLHHIPNVHSHGTDCSGLGFPDYLPHRVYDLSEPRQLRVVV